MTRLFSVLTIALLVLVDLFAYSSNMAFGSYITLSLVFSAYVVWQQRPTLQSYRPLKATGEDAA